MGGFKRELDLWLLKKVENVEIPSKEPFSYEAPASFAKAMREYWYEKGREEALMEVRVALREGLNL